MPPISYHDAVIRYVTDFTLHIKPTSLKNAKAGITKHDLFIIMSVLQSSCLNIYNLLLSSTCSQLTYYS